MTDTVPDEKKGRPDQAPLFYLVVRFYQLPAISTATATTTASFTTPTPVTEAAGPPLLRPRFVHRQVTAIEIGPIKRLYRLLSLFGRSHLDETEATGSPRKLISNHPRRLNGPVRREDFL
jgi:hypothetical protein